MGASHNHRRPAIDARGAVLRCHIGGIVNGLTWFWPSVAGAVVVTWLVAPAVASTLRTNRWLAWLLVLSIGLIMAATVTPVRPPVGVDVEVERYCDLSRRWFATLPEMTAWSDVTLNIGVYIPIGVAIALLPIASRSAVVAAAVIALPAVIEAFQFLVPVLARGCQSADAIDGLTGLTIGLLGGIVVRIVRWPWSRRRVAEQR